VDGDVKKTAFRIEYRSYEFFMMLFRLYNALSTFTTLMNTVFCEEINKFIIVCIDDMLVFSKSVEEHMKHLEILLQELKENKLYINGEKSEFSFIEIEFLEHIMTSLDIRVDDKKVETIKK